MVRNQAHTAYLERIVQHEFDIHWDLGLAGYIQLDPVSLVDAVMCASTYLENDQERIELPFERPSVKACAASIEQGAHESDTEKVIDGIDRALTSGHG